MKREMWELKGISADTRQLVYAVRKVYSRGNPPESLKNRFKSRLLLVKNRINEINRAMMLSKTLTQAEQAHLRKEMNGVRGHCREIERHLSGRAAGARPVPRRVVPIPVGPGARPVPPGEPQVPGDAGPEPPDVAVKPGHCPVCGDPCELPPPVMEVVEGPGPTAAEPVAPSVPPQEAPRPAVEGAADSPPGPSPAPPDATIEVAPAPAERAPEQAGVEPVRIVRCPSCGVAYHADCWEYYSGCAIYGCPAAPAVLVI